MTLTMRPVADEADCDRIRAFLREVFVRNGRRELCWQTYRFDYSRWHLYENLRVYKMDDVLLWEDGGQLAAVLVPESRGEVHLQVHPDAYSPELEAQMVDAAEERLVYIRPGGGKALCVWSPEEHVQRQSLLAARGYARCDGPEHQRRRSVLEPIPDAPFAAGYTVRALGGIDELPARSWASWRAFHPEEPDDAYEGWEWYPNVQRAPLYRRDLDIVAVAPDGAIASFCTVWFDDVTRTGSFEPVGTAPEHQRRGLGKAVMCEGLRRLANLGATLAMVSSFSAPAHALYASAGFREYDLAEAWLKRF